MVNITNLFSATRRKTTTRAKPVRENPKRRRLPRTLINVKRQTAASGRRSKKADSKLKALHPGKRISKNRKIYYETRVNRSDKNRTKRL